MNLVHRIFARFLTLTPAVMVVLFLTTVDVFARAGGGGGYSGGGGGGGGFGGGGGSGGGGGDALILIYYWFAFCRHYPYLGIPATLVGVPVIFFAFYKGAGQANGYHQASTIRRGRRMQESAVRVQALATLVSRDADFNETAFLGRVTTAFMQLQQAWCNQNLEPVRPFVSDGIWERFSLQIREQKDAGYRDYMEHIQVLDAQIAQIESDQVFDTLTVMVHASAVDYRVALESGKRLSGATQPEPFTEYWSFIRRPGAKTLQGGGLIEGNCPNCGAGLRLNEAAECEACNSLVKSGEYDWVLAEITQACEWQAKAYTQIPGVADLQAEDPGFSVQHLEDRVSVMFWRVMAARRAGRADPVRKMAADEFCTEFSRAFTPDENGVRRFPGECAVGAVETLGVLQAEPMDRALVQVRWSGAEHTVERDGKMRKTAAARVVTEVFICVRRHGVQSDASRSLSSAHCPNCGAAATAGTANACEYCGTVLNDGSGDWVLEALRPPHDQRVTELRGQMQQVVVTAPQAAPGMGAPAAAPSAGTRGGTELMTWMIQVMLADGQVDAKERALIDSYAAARNIPTPQLERLIQAMSAGQLEAPQPADGEEAKVWLEGMATMALADGFISKEEQQAILTVGRRLGFSAYDVNQLVLRRRRELCRESKAQMRELKAAGKST